MFVVVLLSFLVSYTSIALLLCISILLIIKNHCNAAWARHSGVSGSTVEYKDISHIHAHIQKKEYYITHICTSTRTKTKTTTTIIRTYNNRIEFLYKKYFFLFKSKILWFVFICFRYINKIYVCTRMYKCVVYF